MPTLKLLFVRLLLLFLYFPMRFIVRRNIHHGISMYKTVADFEVMWKQEWKEQTLL